MARIRIREKKVNKRLDKIKNFPREHKLIALGVPIAAIGIVLMLVSAVPHYVQVPYVTSSGQLSVNNASQETFYFSNVENYKTIVNVSIPQGENVSYTLYTVHVISIEPGVTHTTYYYLMNGTFNYGNSTLILGSFYHEVNYKMVFQSTGEPVNFSANATSFMLAKAQTYFNLEVTGGIIVFFAIAMIVVDISMEKIGNNS